MTVLSKKVCLLGDFAVGKTSLVKRFVYDVFDDKYISTIGVKVSRKTIHVPYQNAVAELNMMVWDLASGEDFGRMHASYLRGAAGALLVCDLSRFETVESLALYCTSLIQNTPGAQAVVAANKSDLLAALGSAEQEAQLARLESVVVELGAPFYLTSALTGDGVEEAFRHLGRLLLS